MSPTQPNIVLTNYPLSREFRSRIEAHLGVTPRYLNVAELRQVPIVKLLIRMMAERAPLVLVAIENESSRPAAPILSLLAALTRSSRVGVIESDLTITPIRRLAAFRQMLRVAFQSARSLSTVGLASWRMTRQARATKHVAAIQQYRRVAYLNCNLYVGLQAGGSVGHVSGVANAFSDLGLAVDFFSVSGKLMVDDRARYVHLAPPSTISIPLESTYYQFDRELDQRVWSVLRAKRPDFVYQRISLGNYLGPRIARRMGIPLVTEYNGSEAWVAKHWGRPLRFHRLAVQAEELCLRCSDVVVTVSDVLGAELVERGLDKKRVVVYPNCIDPRMFDPARFSSEDRAEIRRELGFDHSNILATFIGTFGQWHGVEKLALAIRMLVQNDRGYLLRTGLRFALIGDGAKMPAVRELVGDDEFRPFVRLTGLVPQALAPRYLAASDILISPHVANQDGSAFFGSPTKLFEYMAMGKAIVASDLDQIGQVLRPALVVGAGVTDIQAPDSRNALAVLVPPGNVDALISAIRTCCSDGKLRESLGSTARAEALAKYTWRHHVDAIMDRLKSLCPPESIPRHSSNRRIA